MHKFEYRAPRFHTDLPIRLTLPSAVLSGRCIEISVDGMRAYFTESLPLNASGTVSLSHRDLNVQVRVRVVHTGADFDGLSFHFETERDRRNLDRLVASLAVPGPKLGPVLVK